MRNTLAVLDLDRTLIYSESAFASVVGTDCTDESRVCVEIFESKPLSYLTNACAELLLELAQCAAFVPATTRTREQYARVRLPVGVPEYAICANGGHILVAGQPDWEWHQLVRRKIQAACAPLEEIRGKLRMDAAYPWLLNTRTADDLFVYSIVDRPRVPATWLAQLSEGVNSCGWTISLQGRKLYALPKPLSKGAAMIEVAQRVGASRVLAAGDSLLDKEMLVAADLSWRPGHGELADSGWSAPTTVSLGVVGALAGEEILRCMLQSILAPTQSTARKEA